MRWSVPAGLRGLEDTNGGVMIFAALAAPVLLGFVGLSIDVGLWYASKRVAQAATDSAAIAGALEILRSDSDATAVAAAASQDLADHGFSTAEGDAITVNFPPTSGPQAGAGDSVEVIVNRPVPSYFSRLVFEDTTTIAARAVAVADVNDTCVWALNPTEASAIKVSGGAQVNLGCGMIANSADPTGLTQSGSGCLNSTKIKVVGGYSGTCISPQPLTGVTPVIDPLASLPTPTYGSCDFNNNITVNGGQVMTLSPGVYCGKIKVISNGTLNFEPGLYVLDGAGMEFSAQSIVTGSDVSFYLTEDSGTSDSLSIAAGATVSLSAPADGPLPGVLFYHDRDSPTNVTHSLTGGANMQLEGILYFPSQDVSFSGGSALNSSTSLIIADTVTFTGNTEVGGFEDSPVLANPLLISATLVE